MTDSCSSCRFGAPANDRLPSSLECRRHPPVGGGRRHMAEWPLTPTDAWCGEFETRPTTKPVAKKRPAAGDVETRSEQG